MQKDLKFTFTKIIKKLKFGMAVIKRLFFNRLIAYGMNVRIPSVYMVDPSRLISEKWLVRIIKEILKITKGIFIDVGVNLGQTLLKVKSVKPEQDYYGFEPNPMCYYYAEKLILLNKYENCTLVPVGLSNENSIVTLFSGDDTDDTASLVCGFERPGRYHLRYAVPVFKGDYLIDLFNIKSISIIKIDVEGSELEVIKGLKNTLLKFRPYILCEILPIYDEESEVGRLRIKRQEELETILKNDKYEIFRLLHNGGLISIDRIEVHSDLSLIDYIFIPSEKKEKIVEVLNAEI